MNYITNKPRKFKGVRYQAGDKIPEGEFTHEQELLKDFLADGSITYTGKSLSRKEAASFNDKVITASAPKSPDLQSMEWREAVDTVMEITVGETLYRLQSQENKRVSPRKSVLKAIQSQLKIYS